MTPIVKYIYNGKKAYVDKYPHPVGNKLYFGILFLDQNNNRIDELNISIVDTFDWMKITKGGK